MKLSNETLSVLKNFASINSGIFFKSGSVISTVSPQKNILVDAEITESIPTDFGIYDLNEFLSVISLFRDGAELEFGTKNVVIKGSDGRSKIKYRFTDPSMIVVAPEKRPNIPNFEVNFELTSSDFEWVLKTANVLGSPNVGVVSDGSSVSLNTFDVNNDAAHENSVALSGVSSDTNYKLIFKTENLKILPGDYRVEISSKGIAKFTGKSNGLCYFVTLETSSQYN